MVDGDKSLVVADRDFVRIAERNMNGIVPLYYNMRKAEPTKLNNKNIYAGLNAAFTGGNIGIYSNNISKIWNSEVFINGTDEEKEHAITCVKRLCCQNNFVMAKLQFATLSNLTEFLSLHNVQIDAKISEAVKSSIKTVSQSADGFTLYFYTKTAPVTVEDAVFTITLPKDAAKADKVTGAVAGHLAGLDSNGNIVDSGKTAADFDEAGAATKAKGEVMTYVGTIPADAKAKDVVTYIKEAVTASSYDDSTLRAEVNKNTAAITTLNGTGDGSVKKAVSDAVAAIVNGAPEAYDTLKEISDWISSHASDASAMNSQIKTNKEDIANLKTLIGTLPDTATKSVKYATSAGSAGNSAKWNGYELDLATDNTKDTWLLVANNGKIQHRLSTSFASASHTHSYLPLSGGTLTGFVSQTGSGSKDVGYEARNTDTGASIKFMVGSGKWNKGLYDTNAGNWMVYADQNNKVYLNGTAATASAVSWKNVTDKRRCYVGQSGSTKTKPWYKFASFKTTVAYEDRRISFKVSGGFGSNDSRCGVLTAHLRTNEHKNEESVWLRWEYATNLIDPSKFVLIYKNTTNTSTDVELWVKIDEPYVFYHFTVLTEEYRDIFADYSWTLYNQHSAGYADAPTSGYTQVYSKVCHLADKMSMSSLYGYYGMITPSGSDREYIRTTSNGLLPYQSGGAGNGHSVLGTSSWYFSSAYIDNVNAAASVKIGQPNNSNNGAIELYGGSPYIDFHAGGTNTDYTSRIIAYSDRIEFVFA